MTAQATHKLRQVTRQRARQLYDYLVDYKMRHDGLSPGLQRICAKFQFNSTNTAEYYLSLIENAGCIRRVKKHHGIQLKGGLWKPPQVLPEFSDPILENVYRFIIRYKRNNDGLSPPALLIRHQSYERILSVSEVENALSALEQANHLIKDESGLRVVGATWTIQKA